MATELDVRGANETMWWVRVACVVWVVWAVFTVGLLAVLVFRPPDAVRAMDYLSPGQRQALEMQKRWADEFYRERRPSAR